MKRKSLKLIACAAIMAMTLSVTACGGSDDAAPATETEAASGDTVESLLSDPAVKAQYEEAFAAYEEQGMSVAVDAKGNELIMTLKITDSSLMQDGMAEQLEAGLDTMSSTFEASAGSLDEAVGASGECTYTVRYLDPDDNVLAEKSFSAQ